MEKAVPQRKRRSSRSHQGLGQLSLIEHALCPLHRNKSSGIELSHDSRFHYTDSYRKRRQANVRVIAPLGLFPSDEVYLWGLLALTMAYASGDGVLTATPHWCLRRMGLVNSGTRRGGRQYLQFAAAVERLSVVNYLSDACYDPARAEHRKVSFHFFSYSLPVNPASDRAWTIIWDPVFFQLVQQTGGGMKFDLKLYKTLSPAARRLFLLVLKVSYGKRRLPVFELRHLAVDVLGFASTLAVRDMKVKVRKALEQLEAVGAVQNSTITKGDRSQWVVAFERGVSLQHIQRSGTLAAEHDSPLIDGLLTVGFDHGSAARIVQRYSHRLVAEWIDITLAARERFGEAHFRKSPMAFLMDSLKKAQSGERTPPDWWQQSKRTELRNQKPTVRGQQVLSRLMNEVFGEQSESPAKKNKPELAGDLLKRLA
jgi:hypothetical protein